MLQLAPKEGQTARQYAAGLLTVRGTKVTQGPDRGSLSYRVFHKELKEGAYKIIDVSIELGRLAHCMAGVDRSDHLGHVLLHLAFALYLDLRRSQTRQQDRESPTLNSCCRARSGEAKVAESLELVVSRIWNY